MRRNQSIKLVLRVAAAMVAAVVVANSSAVVLAHGAGGDIGLWSITIPAGEKIDI
jgi:hypothetical protein